MTVGELIERLGGELLRGDAETALAGVADVARARELDLVFGESLTAAEKAAGSWASAAVVPADFTPSGTGRVAVIAAAQPRLWFAKAARLLAEKSPGRGVHASAVIAADAHLAETVLILAGVVVGHGAVIGECSRVDAGVVVGDGVVIGEHCRIYPRVVIYPGTTIGDRVVVHAGAVLGADGFGYVRDAVDGSYTQFPQQGRLAIEDDVEIGANTTIDRGALSETRIRRGTKLD